MLALPAMAQSGHDLKDDGLHGPVKRVDAVMYEARYDFNDNVARVNLHHIVFTANAPEVTITLDNALAAPGENLGVNFVSLTPFLLEAEE